ncbi:hypothetical protein PHYPSEUDO_004288 [Phytophthora pseudosyringae]|uniref:Uncharacterized protein n=1 Tax=Phytophthora pseudosyringae TaxID=221518 RepID=A0A8T1VNH4_9STRA|nr:hypothetical protein PHYPSEUDO_004288 [Phytophthora pseudosyringae]
MTGAAAASLSQRGKALSWLAVGQLPWSRGDGSLDGVLEGRELKAEAGGAERLRLRHRLHTGLGGAYIAIETWRMRARPRYPIEYQSIRWNHPSTDAGTAAAVSFALAAAFFRVGRSLLHGHRSCPVEVAFTYTTQVYRIYTSTTPLTKKQQIFAQPQEEEAQVFFLSPTMDAKPEAAKPEAAKPEAAKPAPLSPSHQDAPHAPKSPARSTDSLLKSPSAFEQKPLRMPKPMSI